MKIWITKKQQRQRQQQQQVEELWNIPIGGQNKDGSKIVVVSTIKEEGDTQRKG